MPALVRQYNLASTIGLCNRQASWNRCFGDLSEDGVCTWCVRQMVWQTNGLHCKIAVPVVRMNAAEQNVRNGIRAVCHLLTCAVAFGRWCGVWYDREHVRVNLQHVLYIIAAAGWHVLRIPGAG